MRTRTRGVVWGLCTALLLAPGAARAESPESLPVESERGTAFERFFLEHPWLTTGLFLAGGGLLAAFADDPADPRWVGGNGFDDPVRSGLRFDSARGRDRADLASDVFQYALIAAPYVDALAYYALTRDPEDPRHAERNHVTLGMLRTSLNMWALTTATTVATKAAAGRQRPDSFQCLVNGGGAGCDSENSSFFSGHSSISFAGAGRVCGQHKHHEFFRASATASWDWRDTLVCGSSVLAATSAAMLRVGSDKHWATDVIVGASVGWVFGFVLPDLWYNRHYRPRPGDAPPPSVIPLAGRDSAGLLFVKRF